MIQPRNVVFAALLICATDVLAQISDMARAISDLGLPVVEIITQDGEEPTCETIEAPEGCMGQGITNMNKVNGRLSIIAGSDVIYDSGDYDKGMGGMVIRVRGNSSAWQWKRPYKVKLQKKADLLNRGDNDRYSDKDWLLIKDEQLSLNTIIGLKVNELIGMQWTPAYELVNVILNNDYRGVYYLIESVKRNNRCRLDVDKETGYLFEYDPYWWNEDLYFDTSYTLSPDAKSAKFTFKEPDPDTITPWQIAYLRDYLNRLEEAFGRGDCQKYLDIDSFVSWLIAQDILGNGDGHGSNMFLTKHDNTEQSLVRMANLWDFDVIMKTADEWSQSHGVFYFGELWSKDGAFFEELYRKKWNAIKNTLFPSLQSYLESFADSETGLAYARSIPYDSQRWGKTERTLEEMLLEASTWFSSRREWMENQVNGGESIPMVVVKDNLSGCYDLNGHRLSDVPPKGLYIRDGKTFMKNH